MINSFDVYIEIHGDWILHTSNARLTPVYLSPDVLGREFYILDGENSEGFSIGLQGVIVNVVDENLIHVRHSSLRMRTRTTDPKMPEMLEFDDELLLFRLVYKGQPFP
jgi:hypothetical protein